MFNYPIILLDHFKMKMESIKIKNHQIKMSKDLFLSKLTALKILVIFKNPNGRIVETKKEKEYNTLVNPISSALRKNGCTKSKETNPTIIPV
jgi:hypothetical protein